MTGRAVLRRIDQLGGVVVRQKGSHVRVELGECATTVPIHRGQDIPTGTLRRIERDLAPCVGKTRWLR
jgi:predicted RNA binding protein YcfA (HicA-like mRNA interferase family)